VVKRLDASIVMGVGVNAWEARPRRLHSSVSTGDSHQLEL
jgi:hypothetical protein